MFDFEARVDVLRIAKTMNEQAGAHQSDQRERDLHHDQNTAQTIPARTTRGPICAVTQDNQPVSAGRLQRRHQPEQQRGQ